MTKNLRSPAQSKVSPRQLAMAGVLTLVVMASMPPALANTDGEDAVWNPVASERLIKLPGAYLKRAVDNDFAGSGLAAEIRETQGLISLKTQTLADLQGASEQAEGDLQVELQHQFLAEKRDYLELVSHHQELRRKQIVTKQRLFERLLGKLDREQRSMTPARQALIEKQISASQRMEGSVSTVDLQIFRSPATSQSKYSRDYAKNMVAIERLVEAIKAHPMSKGSQIDGQPVTKREYLRQLVTETEAELQVMDQEATVLGYMAKLIALDALALSDLLAGDASEDEYGEPVEEASVSAAVDYFIAQ